MRSAWLRRSVFVAMAVCLLALAACAEQPVAIAEDLPTVTATATALSTATATLPPTTTAQPSNTPLPTSTPPPPPRVVASYPVSDDFAVDPTRPVRIVFDQEMDMASAVGALSIEPWVEGEVRVASPRELLIVPKDGWTAEAYELTVTQDAMDPWGQPLRAPFTLKFETTGSSLVLPILMYHRLAELDADATELQRTWTVKPDAFAEQMRYLAQEGYHSITPSDLYAYWHDQVPLPPKPIMITMDDGYADLYTVAMPVFLETGLRPVLFIFPKVLGYGMYIGWEQLQELVNIGCVIGSHSYNHENLRDLDQEGLRYEVVDSKTTLEERLGISIDSFCYPYGSYDQRTLDLLSEEGYTTGFTLNPTYYQRADSPLLLGRLRVDYGMSLEAFVELFP
ncbi:MAG: polysaccharide deacetylase family protein [Anaerolineae bacterium]